MIQFVVVPIKNSVNRTEHVWEVLQTNEDLIQVILETDGDLSDLMDSDFKNVMKATDVSSEFDSLSDIYQKIKGSLIAVNEPVDWFKYAPKYAFV